MYTESPIWPIWWIIPKIPYLVILAILAQVSLFKKCLSVSQMKVFEFENRWVIVNSYRCWWKAIVRASFVFFAWKIVLFCCLRAVSRWRTFEQKLWGKKCKTFPRSSPPQFRRHSQKLAGAARPPPSFKMSNNIL